ncbi:MAG: DUF6488 family protein [Thermodesulfobacteriota bacterium]
MRRITVFLIMILALVCGQVYGGDGHDHANELSQEQIQEKASSYVATIVEKGKLAASWNGIPPGKAIETAEHEWLVSFHNPHEKDLDKQTLYLFLSLSGEYRAANFTGK